MKAWGLESKALRFRVEGLGLKVSGAWETHAWNEGRTPAPLFRREWVPKIVPDIITGSLESQPEGVEAPRISATKGFKV